MKKYRFLLIPKSNYFEDIIQINALKKELLKKDQYVKALTGPMNDESLKWLLEEFHFDVVFQVNKVKSPIHSKFKNVRFISWMTNIDEIQQHAEYLNNNDIIYLLNPTEQTSKARVSNFFPAIDLFKTNYSLNDLITANYDLNNYQSYDISYISNEILMDFYQSDGKIKKKEFNQILKRMDEFFGDFKHTKQNFMIYFFGIARPSDKLLSNKYAKFLGTVKNYNLFYDIARLSKINAISEKNSFHFNTNFFRILSVQGLILVKKQLNISKYIHKLGFNEGMDFLSFSNTKELQDIIDEYLVDSKKRNFIGSNAQKFALDKHTYQNRVDQLLKDLA